jgi:GntR family transcriptional regulator
MVLDAQNPIPLYFQLKNIIEEQISSGELKAGDKILSENSLCVKYQVSRTTARQAITELVNTGKVVRTQGRGTFVAHNPVNRQPYRLTGFSADMKKQGLVPSSKTLELKVIMPTADVAKMLRIGPTEAVLLINRLRYIDGHVMGVEYTHMPFNRFSTLIDEDLENNSLYETLIKKYDTIPTRVAITFEAVQCDEKISELLHTTKGSPLLHISDITFDQNDRLIEYSWTYYRGDLYTFHVEINKHQNENLLFVRKGFENSQPKNHP